ncbi:amidase [Sunxiuqinia sp. A32]|uniref:amidase n=1 Tax=Sunxiuqinia sp. A32 TaxID=3461496 RepID=UPI0040465B3B
MKRRHFMKSALAGGSVVSMVGISACKTSESEGTEINPSTFELNEITIDQLQQKMANGELTSVAICKKYIERIESVDSLLNSVIELNPDGMAIAAKLDQERKDGKVRGFMHGIPVLIKDNIDTGDQMMTTAGSLALAGTSAPDDAFVVKKLRDAGAVLLGKANLSEWANIRSTRSSSGWSGRGGQVHNPFCLDRSPCGSSSGTGAAVSANLCAIGIGTETDGSIVCPSGINGIVGIKPTLGMWSRDGIVPISHSQDTAGPMARNVRDAAILLGALAEFDHNDAPTGLREGRIYSDYTPFLTEDGLNSARIGIVTNFFGFHKEVDKLMMQTIQLMKDAGAELVDGLMLQGRGEWGGAEWKVLIHELKADMETYLASRKDVSVKTLGDIIEFNNRNADSEMPWFGQEIFEEADKTMGIDDPEYLEALRISKLKTREEGIDKIMDEYQLDALIAPTNGPAWPIDLVNGDHFIGGSSDAAAISGYPNITVPAGYVHGLPIGVSFFGRAWSEPVLLKIAYAYEQASRHRKAPDFLKTIS